MDKLPRDKLNDLIEEMYRQYAATLKYFVLSLGSNSETADDIVAETFLKAINNIEKFDGENVRAWLLTIAKNLYYDYLKKKEHKNLPLNENTGLEITLISELPEAACIEKSERIRLYHLLHSLDFESREVVYLRMFTDLSFREIGELMDKSENWARVTFYRSKIRLKEKMKKMAENE